MSYKRNQLEEAISAVVEPRAKHPSAGLRIKLKRLLEADRALEFKPRSSDPLFSKFAFFSEESPGRGVEVRFSEYEIFAVCVALQFLANGWTPRVAASAMRRTRQELEVQYTRVLRLCSLGRAEELDFDRSPILVATTGATSDGNEEAVECCVRENHVAAAKWTWEKREQGQGFAMFHFAHYAQLISRTLEKTEPRHRGQQG